MSHENGSQLTIDELARRVGMTVRNVRAHQSRGLLPPPEIRGRTGFYGDKHVERLNLVKDLQTEGFNLEAIRRILERDPDATSAGVLDFTRAVTEPFIDEQPTFHSSEDLLARWGDQATPQLVERVQKLGFLRPVDDTTWEVLSPRLEGAAEQLGQLGVSFETTIRTVETIKKHSEAVAKTYVDLFLNTVWRPFQEAGEPEDQWPEVRDALERLRPLAAEALLAVFQITMTTEVEQAMEREIARIGRGDGGKRRRR